MSDGLLVALIAGIPAAIFGIVAVPPLLRSRKAIGTSATLDLVVKNLGIERDERKALEERHRADVAALRDQMHKQDADCRRDLGDLRGRLSIYEGDYMKNLGTQLTPVLVDAVTAAVSTVIHAQDERAAAIAAALAAKTTKTAVKLKEDAPNLQEHIDDDKVALDEIRAKLDEKEEP